MIWDTFFSGNLLGNEESKLVDAEGKLKIFMARVIMLRTQYPIMDFDERVAIMLCLRSIYSSFDYPSIRAFALRFTSIPLWLAVDPSRVALEISRYPALGKPWARCKKNGDALFLEATNKLHDSEIFIQTDKQEALMVLPEQGTAAYDHLIRRFEYGFIPSLVSEFLAILEAPFLIPNPSTGLFPTGPVRYLEAMLQLFIDLLSQLPTRRFFLLLLENSLFLLRCKHSSIFKYSDSVPSLFKSDVTEEKLKSSPTSTPVGLSFPDNWLSQEFGRSGHLFFQLLSQLSFLLNFEVNEHTGLPLHESTMENQRYDKVSTLQRLVYKHLSQENKVMREFALGAVTAVGSPESLYTYLDTLSYDQLLGIARHIRVLPTPEHKPKAFHEILNDDTMPSSSTVGKSNDVLNSKSTVSAYTNRIDEALWGSILRCTSSLVWDSAPLVYAPPSIDRSFVLDVLLETHKRQLSQLEMINSLPLFPDEKLLWDPHLVPQGFRLPDHASTCLPHLNLQFLTLTDYLMRGFTLFRLESSYSIRSDMVDVVRRIAPRYVSVAQRNGQTMNMTQFTGWAKMAVPLLPLTSDKSAPGMQANNVPGQECGVSIVQIDPPPIGSKVPAKVLAKAAYTLQGLPTHAREEWDELKEHDVVFLVTIRSCVPPHLHPNAMRDAKTFHACLLEANMNPAKHLSESQMQEVAEFENELKRISQKRQSLADEYVSEDSGSMDVDTLQSLDVLSNTSRITKDVAKTSSRSDMATDVPDEEDFTFWKRWGIEYVRGAEVLEIRDEIGQLFGEAEAMNVTGPSSSTSKGRNKSRQTSNASSSGLRKAEGSIRTVTLSLDPCQYHDDLMRQKDGKEDVSSTFNLLVRRDPRKNNFKAILHAVREALNFTASTVPLSSGASAAPSGAVASSLLTSLSSSTVVSTSGKQTSGVPHILPPWLLNLLLGFGDPRKVHYRSLPELERVDVADFHSIFTSAQHVLDSFPNAGEIVFRLQGSNESLSSDDPRLQPPFLLTFESTPSLEGADAESKKRKVGVESQGVSGTRIIPGGDVSERIVVTPIAPVTDRFGHIPTLVKKDAGTDTESSSVKIEYTPAQVEVIRSGLNKGLTVVVGPPGTGKTDTAVALIASIYKNFPSARILLTAHSNAALNDLFRKLVTNDTGIASRHLLRLGTGAKDLDLSDSFSRVGRLAAALTNRLECLQMFERIANSLGFPTEPGTYTCETARYFSMEHIYPKIRDFRLKFRLPVPPSPLSLESVSTGSTNVPTKKHTKSAMSRYAAAMNTHLELHKKYDELVRTAAESFSMEEIQVSFPFGPFFAQLENDADPTSVELEGSDVTTLSTSPSVTPSFLTSTETAYDALLAAETAFARIMELLQELEFYRPYETLRASRTRVEYGLLKGARIIGMTTTHAAIAKPRLQALGFAFDTLVMEEAGQVSDIETIIPMLLNKPYREGDVGIAGAGLQRVILIGDHHQLPPVVTNTTLARIAKLDQSLFARLIRLGTPHLQLDAQGRARPEIAKLYNWRYATPDGTLGLRDLPFVAGIGPHPVYPNLPNPYAFANAGLKHTFQFINVDDFEGVGESCPAPHVFVNLGEAEFMVAMYQYLRICGYKASSIALLTTYNGQAALLRDIVRARCESNPMFGAPGAISTVDSFQGQQADIVLLSLVRTRSVGHIRDVRRLVVALSRAKFGLYVFGRASLFRTVPELRPAFQQLLQNPLQLELLLGEQYPSERVIASKSMGEIPEQVELESQDATGQLTMHNVKSPQAFGALLAQITASQYYLMHTKMQQEAYQAVLAQASVSTPDSNRQIEILKQETAQTEVSSTQVQMQEYMKQLWAHAAASTRQHGESIERSEQEENDEGEKSEGWNMQKVIESTDTKNFDS